jgi:hypothetical protein
VEHFLFFFDVSALGRLLAPERFADRNVRATPTQVTIEGISHLTVARMVRALMSAMLTRHFSGISSHLLRSWFHRLQN